MRTILRAVMIATLLVSVIPTGSIEANSAAGLPVQTMLHKWQTRLTLTDWQIDVRIVPAGSLGVTESGLAEVANILYDLSRRSAAIRIENASSQEVEEALVHELVHLTLAAWLPPNLSEEEEHTVDKFAAALISAGPSK